MPKNIAFLADGTWNGTDSEDANQDGITDLTNVIKMFCSLEGAQTLDTTRLQDEQELVARDAAGTVTQHAKYIHGVGDSRNLLARMMGGVFGSGTLPRIVRGYTFISRNYRPGDRIYLSGFSRGAYTARALGGMIASVGLLDAAKLDLDGDRLDAYRYGISAWVAYRRASGVVDLSLDSLEQYEGKPVPDGAMIPDVPIEAIGVWDTVGSLGLPLFAGGRRHDVFRFTNDMLNPKVARGFHAVSIDELRGNFEPTLWKPAANVTQAGFIGAHSDVGGGYRERGLSDIALDWMARELAGCGLRFLPHPDYRIAPDPMQAIHEPWKERPFNRGVNPPRAFAADALALHPSVVERVRKDASYRPRALIGSGFITAGGGVDPAVRVIQDHPGRGQ